MACSALQCRVALSQSCPVLSSLVRSSSVPLGHIVSCLGRRVTLRVRVLLIPRPLSLPIFCKIEFTLLSYCNSMITMVIVF